LYEIETRGHKHAGTIFRIGIKKKQNLFYNKCNKKKLIISIFTQPIDYIKYRMNSQESIN